MPLYTYECKKCSDQRDVVLHMTEEHPDMLPCQIKGCDGMSTRIYKVHQVSVFTPYTTTHITGKPLHISSPGQEAEVCRKHGVTRLLDTDRAPAVDNDAELQKELAAMPSTEQTWQEVSALSVDSKTQ